MTKFIEENTFSFDNVFADDSVNEDVYEQVVRPIVYAAFHKAKVTCFAYGQTGSGKTFTMMGDFQKKIPGLYLLATQDLFAIRDRSFPDITVRSLEAGVDFLLRNILREGIRLAEQKKQLHHPSGCQRECAHRESLRETSRVGRVAHGDHPARLQRNLL